MTVAGAALCGICGADWVVWLQEWEAKLDGVMEMTHGEGTLDAVVCAAGGWAGGYPHEDGFYDSLDSMLKLNLRPAAAGTSACAHVGPLDAADAFWLQPLALQQSAWLKGVRWS